MPSPWTQEEIYTDKITHKLGFGFFNALNGWTGIFFEPIREENITTGLLKGCAYAVANTLGGALQMLTFPIPFDIPLPDGGVHFDAINK
ncbi:MAG: hypothetical protein Q8R76_11400 [Candidatus Omnitrophota bacterium]|nr:hypothetical protein [Candidatus Omnitrophota bacterium]